MLEQPYLPNSRQAAASSMPFDKQPNGKPFTPALSSNLRNTKSPLTPRLAGSTPNSPASATRRDGFVRTRSPARDEPAPDFLNGNVTPRTAARKSRPGTESPATPASNKPATTTRSRAISGAASKQPVLGTSCTERVNPLTSDIQASTKSPTPLYTVHRRVSGAKSAVHVPDDEASKFIRADDARSFVSERPGPTTDPSSFFFVGSPGAQNALSPKTLPNQNPQPGVEEKFFHASDVRRQPPSKPLTRPALPSKPVSVPTNPTRSSHSETARPKTFSSQPASPNKPSPNAQPRSPQKEMGRQVLSPATTAQQNVDRRGSVGSSASNMNTDLRNGHRKSLSTGSLAPSPPRKPSSPRTTALSNRNQRVAEPVNVSAVFLDSPVISLPSTKTQPIQTDLTPNSHERILYGPPISVASPILDATIMTPSSDTFSDPPQTAPSRPAHDPTNARRERKVLDLEISNSSLLAINKTLERELRKQSVELRRFRRLSRSGRLSIAPTNRSISTSTLDTVAEGEGEENVSSADDDSDLDTLDDDLDLDLLSNDSSSVHSPSTQARQRARDEKRLMLDLSKHQQMLLDSQKMTQSIRRCLTWTEELIRDGNKALQYRVGIGDVRLGGRVLSFDEELDGLERRGGSGRRSGSEDEGEEEVQRRGLLSPSVTLRQLKEATGWLTSGIRAGEADEEGVDGVLQEINGQLDGYFAQNGVIASR